MILYLRLIGKSSILFLIFSCSNNPELNYKIAARSLEINKNQGADFSNCSSKEYYEADNLFRRAVVFYQKGDWASADEFFLKSIRKGEDAEEKYIFCNR